MDFSKCRPSSAADTTAADQETQALHLSLPAETEQINAFQKQIDSRKYGRLAQTSLALGQKLKVATEAERWTTASRATEILLTMPSVSKKEKGDAVSFVVSRLLLNGRDGEAKALLLKNREDLELVVSKTNTARPSTPSTRRSSRPESPSTGLRSEVRAKHPIAAYLSLDFARAEGLVSDDDYHAFKTLILLSWSRGEPMRMRVQSELERVKKLNLLSEFGIRSTDTTPGH